MRERGLEPPRPLATLVPETSASTIPPHPHIFTISVALTEVIVAYFVLIAKRPLRRLVFDGLWCLADHPALNVIVAIGINRNGSFLEAVDLTASNVQEARLV